jgi:lipopolysaccharide/colanic/teichoic acid biosynthesis glycosyltransferase
VNVEARRGPSATGFDAEPEAVSRSVAELQFSLKRLLDVVVALTVLIVLLPVLLTIALLVRLSSPGPIIFKQQRLGRDGRRFGFYKFRTMVAHNDPSAHQAYSTALIRGVAAPIGRTYKLAADPRVTCVGAILRRYSLDELPQLFNVVCGEMSLVGPRPPLPFESDLYGEREWRRLAVLPGMTGLWQVSGRCALNFQEMVELDIQYIEGWSLWLDLMILARTPVAVLSGDGAC